MTPHRHRLLQILVVLVATSLVGFLPGCGGSSTGSSGASIATEQGQTEAKKATADFYKTNPIPKQKGRSRR